MDFYRQDAKAAIQLYDETYKVSCMVPTSIALKAQWGTRKKAKSICFFENQDFWCSWRLGGEIGFVWVS